MASFHLLYAFVIMPNRMYTFHHHRIQFHKGPFLTDTAERVKDYISGALALQLHLGKGYGPLCHAFDLNFDFSK